MTLKPWAFEFVIKTITKAKLPKITLNLSKKNLLLKLLKCLMRKKDIHKELDKNEQREIMNTIKNKHR